MQKRCAIFLASALITSVHLCAATSLADIARALSATTFYADSCTYEVLLPSLPDPVTYSIALMQAPAEPADTLAPAAYLIDWSLPAPSGISQGFSAYTRGAHYRFRDSRLQEYHAEWDSAPFAPSGDVGRGVQNLVQFADLLPAYLGAHFAAMACDSSYIYNVSPDSIVGGECAAVVEGIRRIDGYDAAEYTYILDPATFLPRKIELENNPGQLGEQSITIRYAANAAAEPSAIDDDMLAARYPDAFGRYRGSSFSLENLPGKALPRFVAPTTTGERYLHEKGDPLAATTVYAFVDAGVGSTAALVDDVRAAADYLPFNVDVVWAFINHRVDDIEAVIPSIRPGEHLLMNARGAATDCGVGADTPVLIFVGTDGVVKDFLRGYNQDFRSLVIQKASLSN